MERSVVDGRAEVDHRIPGQETAKPSVLDSLFNCGNELTRNRAAEDVVDELELAAARERLELDLAVAELSVAAGLLLMASMRFGRRRDRFAIRNARKLQVHLDSESPLQFRDRHLDV